ncbi:D-alanyl-D-alanine carboxypeptidase [Sansalvadorimonas sp. 2012CJ34-2]|uniref:serine-type D-Ala-D-Ala carboxypeptidase n=1 Tax=Parendozoicomonas callyspongiae TaxID=2942213 RepID=A0ABT0PIV6_9GAMM|nr:D-alanyl-D-alanine carboxypeptidase family protein [Sansalvadorimonas sp. 2012CJ34-2]MCL6271322.1 D-alanyl-D-alanine carboxypeptidase [Sansalvadorimonas sp. 2012CJ34-2]
MSVTFLKNLALTGTLALAAVSANAVTIIPKAPNLNAKGYVLMDFDSGKVIASDNAETQLAPASLTKIMTAFVAGQEINNGRLAMDDIVTVGRKAWSRYFPDSSKMFIEPGDKISVANLLRGIMIQSGNDACVALAEHIAGSEQAFVELMNGWAQQIGMTGTRFVNAHGLDGKGIATTPKDMAILARRLIQDTPQVYDIYKEKEFTWNGITQTNRNKLLWDNSLNVDGMKTGYTSKAGYSLVSSAIQDDMRLISVVMGTPSRNARISQSRNLLTYGFRFYDTELLVPADKPALTEIIWKGAEDQLDITVPNNVYMTLPKSQLKKIDVQYQINEPLQAPIAKGDVVGTASWTIDNETVKEVALVAAETIEQGGFFKRLLDSLKLFFSELFGQLFS